MKANQLSPAINALLQQGTVIPAHPLALHGNLTIDAARQRALTNYYITSGAGGVAVGVHTTQFEIRKPGIDLLEPVLKLAAEEIEKAGMIITGTSPNGMLVEAVEIPANKFYIGVQYHPEFKSRPNRAHPLFREFIKASLDK